MRFEASLKELQNAVKSLEKESKKAAKKNKSSGSINQIDMFSAPSVPSNDVDIEALQNQLKSAISSVEKVLKESA